jgi:hypothetical protein
MAECLERLGVSLEYYSSGVAVQQDLTARPITKAHHKSETEHNSAEQKILDFLSPCEPAGPPLTKHHH